jgi:hypothetical protein
VHVYSLTLGSCNPGRKNYFQQGFPIGLLQREEDDGRKRLPKEGNAPEGWHLPRKYLFSITILALIIVGMVFFNIYVVGQMRRGAQTPFTQNPTPGTVVTTSRTSTTALSLNQILVPANTPDSLSDVPHYCYAPQGCVYHWHIHLDIYVNSSSYIVIPNNLGHIHNQEYDLYVIHTHDYSGIIHIECCTPYENKTFTLGQLFEVWGYPNFNQENCLTYSGQPVAVYVNGALWTNGSIASVPLTNHEEIAITIGITHPPIPTSYSFPPGF